MRSHNESSAIVLDEILPGFELPPSVLKKGRKQRAVLGADTFSQRRSFLKWAGGKSQMLKHLLPLLPKVTRMVEPFAGSAVVSLNAGFSKALVCDSNADLINVYQTLKVRQEEFIATTKALFVPNNNLEEAFYEFRDDFNSTKDQFRKATLFIYLNRHCFNGLCRYNSKGKFNVPYGRYTAPGFPEPELRDFCRAMEFMEFRVQDFQKTFAEVREDDVVFCDPPYVPLSKTASFTAYSTDGFSFEQQVTLADSAREAARNGVMVLISNHDTKSVREMYAGADILPIQIKRFISCKGEARGAVGEVLAIFRP